jgi:gliding motility-associated-like protein
MLQRPLQFALISLFVLAASSLLAQSSGDGKRRYRVTAFKASNTEVNSLSNTADAFPKSTLYIPSAFTPNGDGINDSFGVKAKNVSEINLQIFNRWGELIFESQEISNTWDGSYKGTPINYTDVFVYTLKAKGVNGKPLPEENGTVTLVADGSVN